MKINKVSSDAFAGKRDIDIKFKDGINIIYGKNEAGKSTIVELIRSCLFQNSKLKKNTDKEFIEKYMMNSSTGKKSTIADGKLVFKDNNIDQSIKREWGEKGNSKYFDGTVDITDEEEIKKELMEALKYNEAVYNEIIFSSQKSDQNVINSIFDECKKNDTDIRKDLKSILNKAASNIGNVDDVKIRDSIEAKLKELGSHFDMSQGIPEGGLARVKKENRWTKEKGSILKKYYELEDVKNEKENVQDLEEQLEELNGEISEIETEILELEKEKNLLENSGNIINQKKLLEKLEEELESIEDAKENWPKYKDIYKKLNKLISSRDAMETINSYNTLILLKKFIDEFKKNLEKYKNIDENIINECRDIKDKIKDNNTKIKPIELTATIQNNGSDKVEVFNLLNDSNIKSSGNKYDINSPFKIKVGNDVEINITPKDVDIDSIKKENEELNKKISDIYKKCDVDNFDSLKNLYNDKNELEKKLNSSVNDFERELAKIGKTFEEVDRNYSSLDDKEYGKYKNKSNNEIEKEYQFTIDEIEDIIDNEDENVYINNIKIYVNSCEKNYKDIKNLDKIIDEKDKEIKKINKELDKYEDFDIDDMEDIDDVEKRKEEIEENLKDLNDDLKEKREALGGINNEINGRSAQSFDDTINLRENELNELKEEYNHYEHILKVFNDVMMSNKQNPLKNIETEFIDNVNVITNNGIKIDNSGDVLNISSGNSGLTPSILSEGTKDSIGFAFKLAVVKSLFPDEAFIVLDDPFTDMDEDRVKASCKLLQIFAKNNNQVLFFTCDNKYTSLLSNANIINI